MFIHIGDNQLIRSEDVIVMIDQQYVETSSINEEMVEYQENQENTPNIKDETKTIVVTNDCMYYSPFSILTLKKRSNLHVTLNHLDDYTDSDTLTNE